MKKVEFIVLEEVGDKDLIALEKEYMLLYYFLGTFRGKFDLHKLIEDFTSVETGKKTFVEIQDPNVCLTFGNDSGYLEIDKDIAHFISNYPHTDPDLDMPLKELVELMKQWRDFLDGGAVV